MDSADTEIVNCSMVCGSFGNHYALAGLVEANELGLREKKKLFLFKRQSQNFTNPTLFEYFSPYISIVECENVNQSTYLFNNVLEIPIGACLPLSHECLFLDFVRNKIEQKKSENSSKSLFSLKSRHRARGEKTLREIGLPKDAWFVTLHVREPTFRGETYSRTNDMFRSCDIQQYLPACKEITKLGGWVFRVGDKSMKKLPSIPNVIDYAHSRYKSDWMDIYLAAASRFCIGTASGYFRVSQMFGVPIILTNSTQTIPLFSLTKNDIFLPRVISEVSSGIPLSFSDVFVPPINMYAFDKLFKKKGYVWSENTEDEITEAVKQMCRNLSLQPSPHTSDHDMSRTVLKAVSAKTSEIIGTKLDISCQLSEHFIEKHARLMKSF